MLQEKGGMHGLYGQKSVVLRLIIKERHATRDDCDRGERLDVRWSE